MPCSRRASRVRRQKLLPGVVEQTEGAGTPVTDGATSKSIFKVEIPAPEKFYETYLRFFRTWGGGTHVDRTKLSVMRHVWLQKK